ncbi:MAG: hypothetical protein Q7T01_00720 [bacterium]|nr:hypothetical protein [bacterium]
MLGDVLGIGDEVVVTVDPEKRAEGYNPCPDGTGGTVVGFGEVMVGRIHNWGLRPGVYRNQSCPKVELLDGSHIDISIVHLMLTDAREYERRRDVYDAENRADVDLVARLKRRAPGNFLRELPDTPFWEGDWVHTRAIGARWATARAMSLIPDPELFQVTGIDDEQRGQRTQESTSPSAYYIADHLDAGWHMCAAAEDLVLVHRGPVWQFYHDERPRFNTLAEEARFYELLGRVDEVRNPIRQASIWMYDEALVAIADGIADGFASRDRLLGPSHDLVRFHDRDVGERVRAATLQMHRQKQE